eukprot:gene8873-8962_t
MRGLEWCDRGGFAARAGVGGIDDAIRPGFIQAAMAVLVMQRIHRVRRLLVALEARFLAGLVRRRAVRAVTADVGVEVRERAPRAKAPELLPRRFAWLLPLVPGEAACFAGHLRVVLAEPDMQALLAGCPQAVRVLGPLCVMLGIERAAYVPGWTPTVRVPRVRAPRKAREAVDFAAEDAHYASTQVPRRYRLRVWRFRNWGK